MGISERPFWNLFFVTSGGHLMQHCSIGPFKVLFCRETP